MPEPKVAGTTSPGQPTGPTEQAHLQDEPTTSHRPPEVVDAAPHFYTRRPIHLCADGRGDDDDGPPNW